MRSRAQHPQRHPVVLAPSARRFVHLSRHPIDRAGLARCIVRKTLAEFTPQSNGDQSSCRYGDPVRALRQSFGVQEPAVRGSPNLECEVLTTGNEKPTICGVRHGRRNRAMSVLASRFPFFRAGDRVKDDGAVIVGADCHVTVGGRRN